MDIHLVGGFLGSGKTTAIIAAAKRLAAQGRRVGVVTNDQGRYLVDSAFVQAAGVPAVEVAGGCFCCNYDDLGRMIVALGRRAAPHVIFAESVGSCADLVATVVKPLLAAPPTEGRMRSLSVFADIRLLDRWLDGRPLPFNESVTYIFGKQLEEAGAIIVNKADLVPQAHARAVLARAAERFRRSHVRLQSSLREADVAGWLALIEATADARPAAQLLPSASLDIDYARYAAGEAALAWLDARVVLDCADCAAGEAVQSVLTGIASLLRLRAAAVGHLKALVQCGGICEKISVTAADAGPPPLPPLPAPRVQLGLNARAQIAAGELRAIVRQALSRAAELHGFAYQVIDESAFHPGEPHPTRRIG